jgi:hypothetical protein
MQRSEAYWKKRQECLEQGRDRATKQIAIAALREGYSSEAIRKLTGLSLEEIENLITLFLKNHQTTNAADQQAIYKPRKLLQHPITDCYQKSSEELL